SDGPWARVRPAGASRGPPACVPRRPRRHVARTRAFSAGDRRACSSDRSPRVAVVGTWHDHDAHRAPRRRPGSGRARIPTREGALMGFPGIGIAKGMATTFRNFFSPKVTRQYPEERPPIPDRWRGRLDLIYD